MLIMDKHLQEEFVTLFLAPSRSVALLRPPFPLERVRENNPDSRRPGIVGMGLAETDFTYP